MTATLHPYRLPLVAPLSLAFGTLAHRDGLLLRLQHAEGGVGWGDACPLPGFSPDTLDEARAALDRWILTAGWGTGDDAAHGEAALPPSARAALDGALLDLAAQAAGVSMAEALRVSAAPTVQMQALLVPAVGAAALDPALLRHAEALRAAGYRAAKLKVGALPVADEAARVRALWGVLASGAPGDTVSLRLDANRAWTFADACRFADALRGVRIGYVEEPLADPSRLADLARSADLPVALDETLLETAPGALAAHRYASAVVLKPVVLGGVRAALAWADAARACGMEAVVSGAFESGVGTRHALALAAALGGAPAGLDPYRHLADDVLAPRLPLDRPEVDVAEALAPRRVTVADITLSGSRP